VKAVGGRRRGGKVRVLAAGFPQRRRRRLQGQTPRFARQLRASLPC